MRPIVVKPADKVLLSPDYGSLSFALLITLKCGLRSVSWLGRVYLICQFELVTDRLVRWTGMQTTRVRSYRRITQIPLHLFLSCNLWSSVK